MKYGTSLEHIPAFEYPDYFHLEKSLIDGKEDTGYYALMKTKIGDLNRIQRTETRSTKIGDLNRDLRQGVILFLG